MAQSAPEYTFTLFPKLALELRLHIWELALPGPRVVHIRQRKLKKTIGEWEAETGKQWPVPLGCSETEPDCPKDDEPLYVNHRGKIISEHDEYRSEERRMLHHCQQLHLGPFRPDVGDKYIDAYKQYDLTGIVSNAAFPTGLLYVCRESYGVVTKFYTKSFRCLGSVSSTWFKFDTDTLYLQYGTFSAQRTKFYHIFGEEMTAITDGLEGGHRILDIKNLRKVKKLALSLDLYEQVDKAQLSAILEVFGNIEELSLVLDHFQDGTDEEELLIPDELVDYEETQMAYLQFNKGPWDGHADVPGTALVDTWRAGIDIATLREIRDRDIACFDSFPWKIPAIEPRVVISKSRMARLEKDRKMCENKVAQFREEKECMKIPGWEVSLRTLGEECEIEFQIDAESVASGTFEDGSEVWIMTKKDFSGFDR